MIEEEEELQPREIPSHFQNPRSRLQNSIAYEMSTNEQNRQRDIINSRFTHRKTKQYIPLRGKKNIYKHTHTCTQTLIESEKREEEKWSEGTHFPAK
jgi:hypothetical protein